MLADLARKKTLRTPHHTHRVYISCAVSRYRRHGSAASCYFCVWLHCASDNTCMPTITLTFVLFTATPTKPKPRRHAAPNAEVKYLTPLAEPLNGFNFDANSPKFVIFFQCCTTSCSNVASRCVAVCVLLLRAGVQHTYLVSACVF